MAFESLQGRHVLVLGGSDGIGLAAVEYLLRHGCIVTMGARNEEKLLAAAERLRTSTGADDSTLRVQQVDATVEDQVAAAIERACDDEKELGGVVVVAGAGNFRSVMDNDRESVTDDLLHNVLPLVFTLKHGVKVMERKGGSIVAISSASGVQSSRGLSSFGAGKAGLDHYVRVAADELGRRGIRVNSILPGLVRTGATRFVFGDQELVNKFVFQTPLDRYGLPEDFSATIALLLSDEASWITGQSWLIDGGLTLRAYPDLGVS